MGSFGENVFINGNNHRNSTGGDDPFTYTSDGSRHAIVIVGILISLIVTLCIILLILLYPYLIRLLRKPSEKRDLRLRKKQIDAQLIRQKAQSCSCCVGTLNDTPDEENQECLICFAEFSPKEIICSSPNPQCSHVFHYECIEPWLWKHTDCPTCRRPYLPDDVAESRAWKVATSLNRKQYCVVHGFITTKPPVTRTPSDETLLQDSSSNHTNDEGSSSDVVELSDGSTTCESSEDNDEMPPV